MNQHLTGIRLLDPFANLDRKADLWISDDRIVGVDSSRPESSDAFEPRDASGLWLIPALVDLQADVTGASADEMAAAAAGGVGHLCCEPSRLNPLDSPALVEHLLRECARPPVQVTPLGALTRGLEGRQIADYEALKLAGCGGLSNGPAPLDDPSVLRSALMYAASLDLTVFLQPLLPELAQGCAHEGPISTRLGLAPIPAVAESAALARDLELVADTGARVHFTRLSCARSVDLLARAADSGMAVSADVSIAHLLLTDHDVSGFNPLAHVLPPLRSTTDRQALIDGVRNGVITAVCSDHRPLSADAKLAPFAATEPGISGLETLLALAMRLADDGSIDPMALLGALTSGPARVINQASPPLAPGAGGTWCLWNPEPCWRPRDRQWLSRGRNSPFLDWELKGQVETLLLG